MPSEYPQYGDPVCCYYDYHVQLDCALRLAHNQVRNVWCISTTTTIPTRWCLWKKGLRASIRGLAFSSEGGSQIYKKLASMKLRPPYFGNKNFMTPHYRYTLPPKQAKIVLKPVFEQNKHTICGHVMTPYILVIKNFMTHPTFPSKNLWPQYICDPPTEENTSPLRLLFCTLSGPIITCTLIFTWC